MAKHVTDEQEVLESLGAALREAGLASGAGRVQIGRAETDVEIALDGAPRIRLPLTSAPEQIARVASLLVEHDELSRRRREAEVSTSSALMARVLAHDANNMLNLILTTVSHPLSDRRTAQDSGTILAEATQRLAALLRRLVAHQRHELQPHPIAIAAILRSLLPILKSIAAGRVIETHVENELPEVTMDPVDLERALVNLVANARDATRPGDRIELRAQRVEVANDNANDLSPGPWVDVSVEDRGDGIDAETLARATEAFFTTKSARGGSGLGLAGIARTLRSAGGQLRIESAPGLGTSVHLWIPVT